VRERTLALERQQIERKDFPVGRRGYDTAAVDAHLAAVADEIERLGAATPVRADTVAAKASERVRQIVEAAEQSASEITREAEERARHVRDEAGGEVRSSRERAAAEAREHVARVQTATAVLLQRVEVVDAELSELLRELRERAARLTGDLSRLDADLAELRDASVGAGFEASAPAGADAYSLEEGREERLRTEPPAEPVAPAEAGPPETQPPAEAGPTETRPPAGIATAAAAEGNDAEGARLVALNMALSGSPRDETDRYLAAHYALDDRVTLLDEVYASVGG
jgi:DivIVA domain-containing protein